MRQWLVKKVSENWGNYTEELDDYQGCILIEVEELSDVDGICLYTPDGEDYWWFEEAGLELVWPITPQSSPVETATPVVGNPKYNREIKPGVFVDVYDVLYAFKVTDPCLQHLIKKALAAGQRGHKDARQDLVDIRDSAQRALDSYDLWEVK